MRGSHNVRDGLHSAYGVFYTASISRACVRCVLNQLLIGAICTLCFRWPVEQFVINVPDFNVSSAVLGGCSAVHFAAVADGVDSVHTDRPDGFIIISINLYSYETDTGALCVL